MDPLQEYSRRKEQRQLTEVALQKRFVHIGNWRLVAALVAVAILWLAFGSHRLSPWLALVPFFAFVCLVIWHARVIRQRTLASRAVRYYGSCLGRLEDRWLGNGSAGNEFREDGHVYASDLDVFGKGSLFELVSRARTGPGERTLASWLLAPADRTEALARQEAIEELRRRLDLREEIALLGEDVRSEVHPEKIAGWGAAENSAPAGWLRPLALLLSLAAVATFAAFFGHLLPLWPFAVVLGCNFTFQFTVRKRIEHVMAAVEACAHDLDMLSLVLHRLEQESFQSLRLNRVSDALAIQGQPASRRIRNLQRWVELLDSGDHLLVRVIRPVVLWNEQCALAVEAWRIRNGRHIGTWLKAVGDFEALSSFASLAFERPHWVFPVFVDQTPMFDAIALQHPLLPAAKCVPNDVAIGGELRLLIVSGSNMSGKSTLLRSVGLNTVLAWAGAPVAAASLRISPLQVGASIRVTDSLQDNRSRFFAEISRLRQIVDLAEQKCPVLYLLDELLSGTNSHDRRIGAAAIVGTLFRAGAIGLITTHDLALAEIEKDLGRAAANTHFEDTIIDGRVEFDYRLRPGIVTHSNALELMRAIGLSV
jgi:MutS domain V/MutS domain III